MKRLAILLLCMIPTTAVITTSPATGCDVLRHLLHKCRRCHHCGAYKCHYKRCHRPKCDCAAAHYHGHGHAHHGRPFGFFAPRRHHHHDRYYYGPSYGQPSAPVYEEIAPGRDF